MTTVLVTGATGFIGGRLVARLRADGAAVHALVRRRDDDASLRAAGVEVFSGELGDPNSIAAAAAGCESIYHCAGEADHRADPKALSWIHVAGSENLINAARSTGVRSVIYLSCADVSLDNRDTLTVKEHAAGARPRRDPWSASKLLGEELALQACDSRLSVTAIRPAWVWGAGDTTTLPALCREGLRGRVALCGSGDNLIATCHVDNLVGAMLAAEDTDGCAGKAVHVADSDHVTAREFLGALCEALQLPPPRTGVYGLSYAAAHLHSLLRTGGLWPRDVLRRGRGRLLDVQHMASGIDYMPEVTIDAGMAELRAWVQATGGASVIAKLGRTPATAQDVAHFEALASGSHG